MQCCGMRIAMWEFKEGGGGSYWLAKCEVDGSEGRSLCFMLRNNVKEGRKYSMDLRGRASRDNFL